MKYLANSSIALFTVMSLLFAGVTACDDESAQKKFSQDSTVVPEGFVEHQQLLDADTLQSFSGSVFFPQEKNVTFHGNIVDGMDEFMKLMHERENGLNYIYKQYYKLNPGFEGNLSFDITIDVCGDVTSIVVISSTTEYPKFDQEVKNFLSHQKYPKTTQGHYTVSFSLKFAKKATNSAPVAEVKK